MRATRPPFLLLLLPVHLVPLLCLVRRVTACQGPEHRACHAAAYFVTDETSASCTDDVSSNGTLASMVRMFAFLQKTRRKARRSTSVMARRGTATARRIEGGRQLAMMPVTAFGIPRVLEGLTTVGRRPAALIWLVGRQLIILRTCRRGVVFTLYLAAWLLDTDGRLINKMNVSRLVEGSELQQTNVGASWRHNAARPTFEVDER